MNIIEYQNISLDTVAVFWLLNAPPLQECIAARLRALNEGAVTHFRQNLNHYDEKKGEPRPDSD